MDKPVEVFSKIRIIKPEEFEGFGISEASINSTAKSLMPEGFDASANPDILPVVFNLAVVNEFNANGDGIDSAGAISCVANFKNKPINIEHMKSEIVGHITNASLSKEEFDFSDNDIESFADEKDVFYINAAGFIYRHIFPDLVEQIIECSDVDSETYQEISASWELGSKRFKVATGSKLLKDCQIASKEDAVKLKIHLKGFGGTGVTEEGMVVNRLITGNLLSLGAAITLNPAANVSGVHVVEDVINIESKAERTSPNKEIDVRDRESKKFIDMDEKQFKELMEGVTTSLASALKKDSDVKSVGEIVAQALTSHNSGWESKIQKEADAKDKLSGEVTELTASLASTKDELEKIQNQLSAQASAQVFSDRMGFLDAEYEFSEAESKLIASEVKSLAIEEDIFEAYKSKVDVLFSHKSKASIAKAATDLNTKIEQAAAKLVESKASTTPETVKETKTGETDLELEAESKASVANNNAQTAEKESLVEGLMKNFKVEVEN